MADRMILVRVEDELLFARNRQEREHVAARERSDESLLGIDIGGIAEVGRRRRGRHPMAAVEAPGMIARILLIRKLSSAALPSQSHFVFGHASIYGVGERRRNCRNKPRRRQADRPLHMVAAEAHAQTDEPATRRDWCTRRRG